MVTGTKATSTRCGYTLNGSMNGSIATTPTASAQIGRSSSRHEKYATGPNSAVPTISYGLLTIATGWPLIFVSAAKR